MITIFNTSLAQQGVVTNYSSLTFRRQLRGIGSFALSIAKDKKNTEYLIKGNVIAIDSTTAGVIVDVFEDQTENGVFLQVSGKALVGILGDRITKDATTNYVDKTETIAKAIVNKNCIDATDTNRNFSNFDLIADSARGSSQTFDTLNEPLPKALERLLAIDNYGHQIYIDFANKKFKYDVIVNTDRSASVQFSNKIHNMKKSKSHQSNSNHKTFAYIDGNGVSNSYGSATGYSRKEIYLKDTKIDVEADLPDRASQDLSGKYYETNSIDAVIKVSGNPFVYKTDYDLGNIVSVNINGTLYELQITEITEIYTNQLVDIILTFGTAARSSSNIINDIKELANQTPISSGGGTLLTATITTTWTGSSPSTQDITVSGISADDTPLITPVYSTDNATAILQKTAWNLISKIITGTDKITVYCFEDETVSAIPIQIKGV